MSTISAGTTSGTALVTSGDTTGQLVIQTNGTTTAMTVGTDQVVTVNGTTTVGAQIRLLEGSNNGTNYVAVKAPNSVASDVTFTLPSADGTNGQYLQTNGSGQLAFATVPTTSPAGSTGQVQYNNAGAFGAISSGTSGQVLTSAGAGAAPTWTTPGAPALVYLSTTSVSGSTSFSIPLSSFTSTYNAFRLIIIGLCASSSASPIFPVLRINANTSNYRGQLGGGQYLSGFGSQVMTNDITNGIPLAASDIKGTDEFAFINADILFYNMAASSPKSLVGSYVHKSANTGSWTQGAGGIGGTWANAAAPTSIDIVDTYSPARNMVGTALLYGVKTS